MSTRSLLRSFLLRTRLVDTQSRWSQGRHDAPSFSTDGMPTIASRRNYCAEQRQSAHDRGVRSNLPAVTNAFENASEKTKHSYLAMVNVFINRDKHRRNHVEFIYAALKHMRTFGVEQDLDVYKALINVLPKGKFIPTNIFQAEFMHYPKQQQCAIDLLEQMEDLGVMPDHEMETMLLNVFGRKGHPLRKYWRMMYWMPKFKNLSPWPLPSPLPRNSTDLAKLAVERMCSVDVRSQVIVYETKAVEAAIDDTWIVSGMSVEQSQLLAKHPRKQAVYIEGPFMVWIGQSTINYFTLRADPDPEHLRSFDAPYNDDDVSQLKVPRFGSGMSSLRTPKANKRPSVHEQEDGTIFGICATGTSSKDSLLSWIRLLETNGNPALAEIPVLFRLVSHVGEPSPQITSNMDILDVETTNKT